jgi:hypothetical protein
MARKKGSTAKRFQKIGVKSNAQTSHLNFNLPTIYGREERGLDGEL